MPNLMAVELCSGAYSPEHMEAWLSNRRPEMYHPGLESGGMYVAECGSHVVGFGHAEGGEIHAVFVDPEWIGKGIGGKLLQHGIDLISAEGGKQVFLKATLNAVGFYKTFGFIEKGPGCFDCNGVDIPIIEMTRAAGR